MNYEISYREKHKLNESDLTVAQRTLHFIAENMRMKKSISEDGYKHFQQAIEALKQEPCDDCISRKEMLKYQEYLHGKMSNEENHKLWEFIKGLPSVTPQEPNTWSLDDAREDFMSDVYNTLDFLPTNDEANQIIDSFDSVASGIRQEPILDKIIAEIEQVRLIMDDEIKNHDRKDLINFVNGLNQSLMIIDKYKAESEVKE